MSDYVPMSDAEKQIWISVYIRECSCKGGEELEAIQMACAAVLGLRASMNLVNEYGKGGVVDFMYREIMHGHVEEVHKEMGFQRKIRGV